MAARGILTDGGPPAWAVKSCCLDGRIGLANQQEKRVARSLSKWPSNMEIDGSIFHIFYKKILTLLDPQPATIKATPGFTTLLFKVAFCTMKFFLLSYLNFPLTWKKELLQRSQS